MKKQFNGLNYFLAKELELFFLFHHVSVCLSQSLLNLIVICNFLQLIDNKRIE